MQKQIIEKIQKEILEAHDHEKRFQLIQQLELYVRTVHLLGLPEVMESIK